MLAVGLYASRKSQSWTDFVVAGRKMPLWLCGISVFASDRSTIYEMNETADGQLYLVMAEAPRR